MADGARGRGARAPGVPERAWLAALPAAQWPEDDVLLCHGTPGSELRDFLETVTSSFGADAQGGLRAATADALAKGFVGRTEPPRQPASRRPIS